MIGRERELDGWMIYMCVGTGFASRYRLPAGSSFILITRLCTDGFSKFDRAGSLYTDIRESVSAYPASDSLHKSKRNINTREIAWYLLSLLFCLFCFCLFLFVFVVLGEVPGRCGSLFCVCFVKTFLRLYCSFIYIYFFF